MQPFDALQTKLQLGTNLIEASAGTGKTYTIATLALRFVVEQAVNIGQILVVTFTKAATEELKDRIRARLLAAKQALLDQNTNDSLVNQWLKTGQFTQEHILQRLDNALLTIDQAPIFTIHGFCQRILQEYPLQSGQVFKTELLEDISAIRQQCTDDFWRRQVYSLSAWQASVLTAKHKTPDALLASIKMIPVAVRIEPKPEPITTVLKRLDKSVTQAKQTIDDLQVRISNSLAEGLFKDSFVQAFDGQMQDLKSWLRREQVCYPDDSVLALPSQQGLYEGLNGHKFRKTKQQSGEERKQSYLDTLGIDTQPFDQLVTTIKQCQLTLPLLLLTELSVETEAELQRRNALSFDQLIIKLAEATQRSPALVQSVQHQYPVALIDEFQDTDDHQWAIFSRFFATHRHYLYLIGDPKQAIYKFRGADIYSYLKAQQTANHKYTLSHNWRSHPLVVAGINRLFQRDNPFAFEALSFINVEAGRRAEEGRIYQNRNELPPIVLWQLPPSEKNAGFWTAGEADKAIRGNVINEIIRLLTEGYTLNSNHQEQTLKPKDIAILVRSNRQASDYQSALRAANIPSVLNSMESVFASTEATDLYIVLRAITEPSNGNYFNQALTLDWFGLDGQGFYRFISDESAVDLMVARFNDYLQLWQKSGLMAMMLQLLAVEKVRENLAKTFLAERQLTNIQHLLELLQQAAVDEKLSLEKTLVWLQSAIGEANNNEHQQLRLESDDNAVRIVTTHRSKGLEYNVVFFPYLWQGGGKEKPIVLCHEQGQMVADLGSEDFARRSQKAQQEELAEELRLLYVAVTRAKYRCYMAWADVRSKDKPNQSALAWLLELGVVEFTGQQALLQQITQEYPDIFNYQMLDVVKTYLRYNKPLAIEPLQLLPQNRDLYSHWQMSSFTALSSLTIQDVPEDKVAEQPERQQLETELLPKGAALGNVVHTLLERHSFAQLAQHQDIAEHRQLLCLRYGVKLEQPELLDQLLHHTVSTPLSDRDPGFCLMNLLDQDCLKEMPFYLALEPIKTRSVNAVLQDCPAFQALDNKQLEGYLTGFIDLICCYQGQYYVMDYKTNTLADYGQNCLLQAMREHNYGLQYWLYSLVLHRYLQLRLPGYQFDQHFGGVRYLFVRGMDSTRPMQGVYQDKPRLTQLEALNQLFS